MTGFTVDPEIIRQEKTKWYDRADTMNGIRQRTADLSLGLTAFFPGGMTEVAHRQKYEALHEAAVQRLRGAAVEFELIATALGTVAAAYEDGDQARAQDFRVTGEQLERATDAYPPPRPGRAGEVWV